MLNIFHIAKDVRTMPSHQIKIRGYIWGLKLH